MATRKDNPVWTDCNLTGIETDLQVRNGQSIVTVAIGVKNKGRVMVDDFAVPLRVTAGELDSGADEKTHETVELRFEPVGPGQEVRARGVFTFPGKVQGLWLGLVL
jgi:hypothetical protein